MNSRVIKVIWIESIFLICFVFFACKKDKIKPSISGYCAQQREVNATFFLEEATYGTIRGYDTDTMYVNKDLLIMAYESNANYEWYIDGNKMKESKKYFQRFIGEEKAGEDITICLVVRKTPDKICFPNDDGYDSLIRKIHVAPAPPADTYPWNKEYKHPLEGAYRFYAPHIDDSIDVEFNFIEPDTLDIENKYSWKVEITNFDGEGSNIKDRFQSLNYVYHQIDFVINSKEYGTPMFSLFTDTKRDTYFVLESTSKQSPKFEYQYKGRKL